MTIKRIKESHVDHSLTEEQLAWVLGRWAPDGKVSVQTFTLPDELGTVPCGLYGPVMGDEPVPESDVHYAVRGGRAGESRLTRWGLRQTRRITVVSGPNGDDSCVLYTSYGGPAAPREPFEDTSDESRDFWAQHALVLDR